MVARHLLDSGMHGDYIQNPPTGSFHFLSSTTRIGPTYVIGRGTTRWKHSRHFPSHGVVNLPFFAPWHTGEGHFVTFYIWGDCWSILDPLLNGMPPPPRMQYKLHRALREFFNYRNIPIPALTPYRQLPRIAIQRDASLPLWSCGTFVMPTTLHLLLGGLPPHSVMANYITREHMMSLHRALIEWLILAPPPSG